MSSGKVRTLVGKDWDPENWNVALGEDPDYVWDVEPLIILSRLHQ